MTRSTMRHPEFETYLERDRRRAREEIRRFLDLQDRRKAALVGRRILPAIAAGAPATLDARR